MADSASASTMMTDGRTTAVSAVTMPVSLLLRAGRLPARRRRRMAASAHGQGGLDESLQDSSQGARAHDGEQEPGEGSG
ncbi:hypothetical protein HMPREF0058_0686 [Actinomyces urogenitalis DSM 15434]|uniref:Uncharacterized protein n=1 Tax=Actinomyces urogenitalis DSM 15434 TaxID=525246 RepID=C0W492_9ACTO|nr:hypothetical protein HMPREF0058_0686 [Actinomyces urogenitalis DSM 15434]